MTIMPTSAGAYQKPELKAKPLKVTQAELTAAINQAVRKRTHEAADSMIGIAITCVEALIDEVEELKARVSALEANSELSG